MTPAQRRRLELKRAGIIGDGTQDRREGIPWHGAWMAPEEIHGRAASRMQWFDAQMKSVRNYINRNGELPEGPLRNRVKEK
jgi:hypothetical protein